MHRSLYDPEKTIFPGQGWILPRMPDGNNFRQRHSDGLLTRTAKMPDHFASPGNDFNSGPQRPVGLVTAHRDNFGVQIEVEKLEALMNRPDVSEPEPQVFSESATFTS